MDRPELADRVAQTVEATAAKLEEALTMGKPGEAVDYASALRDAASAFDYIAEGEDD